MFCRKSYITFATNLLILKKRKPDEHQRSSGFIICRHRFFFNQRLGFAKFKLDKNKNLTVLPKSKILTPKRTLLLTQSAKTLVLMRILGSLPYNNAFLYSTNYSCCYHTQNNFAATVRITRNAAFNAAKIRIYFLVCSGWSSLNSLNVIRLASDAISVPVPPMFTPKSNAA